MLHGDILSLQFAAESTWGEAPLETYKISVNMTTTKLMFLAKPTRTERKKAKILLDPYEVKMFLKEKKAMKALFYIPVL